MDKKLKTLERLSLIIGVILFFHYLSADELGASMFFAIISLSAFATFRAARNANKPPKVKDKSVVDEGTELLNQQKHQEYLASLTEEEYYQCFSIGEIAHIKSRELKEKAFRVAGVNFDGRRQQLKEIYKEMVRNTYKEYLYDGLTNDDILYFSDPDERYYQLSLEDQSLSNIYLIPEPDNPYDENAIAVYVDYTHVGYVPKGINVEVAEAMKGHYRIYGKLLGGKYKYYDENNYKVRTKELKNWGVEVTIYYLGDRITD